MSFLWCAYICYISRFSYRILLLFNYSLIVKVQSCPFSGINFDIHVFSPTECTVFVLISAHILVLLCVSYMKNAIKIFHCSSNRFLFLLSNPNFPVPRPISVNVFSLSENLEEWSLSNWTSSLLKFRYPWIDDSLMKLNQKYMHIQLITIFFRTPAINILMLLKYGWIMVHNWHLAKYLKI